ncbi:DUF5683 domain-containing protein [Wenyingzhuangia sp. IMCC45574]
MNKRFFILILTVLSFQSNFAQDQQKDKKEKQKKELKTEAEDNNSFLEDTDSFNPLSPAKAAFYSAVVPGLGQAYNKRYWKIPIVYGALASSIYYYSINNTSYKRYRRAFKLRKAGKPDEFVGRFSDASLENAQQVLRRNRDTSLLTFVGLYALQILEASIDAHLLQFNISDTITFDPKLMNDQFSNQNYVGLSLNLNF